MRLLQRTRARLDALQRQGLLRELRELDSPCGPLIRVEGAELISLSSNDYLGLAAHPALIAAIADGAHRWGAGAGASRLVTGNLGAHRAAERALASWLGQPAALTFASGHAANLGLLQTLLEEGDHVFSDTLDHASLIDGCRLSRAEKHVFRHRDLGHLEELLRAHRGETGGALIVTDAVFSMDGDRADVRGLRALADRYDAALVVDEAHSIGVLGPEGRGLCAAEGVVPEVMVGTLGKSLGLAGAFVAAAPEIVALLENLARSFVFSTALAPPIAAAVPTAVGLARGGTALRERLHAHGAQLRTALREQGWDVPEGDGPIVPVLCGAESRALAASAALEAGGVLCRAIRPPTVPPGTARLRATVSAAHTPDQIERAIAAFARAR